ncbi:YfcC family protein [Vaginisenegalia massiliensis]|uniref:YfcC family protein n=1 Tax=Vaginisenegalia massiliensis TaxID=2058294 RepID=UPI000F534592|nr:YfcC family protein [Vaginisenegalia massiliensis]
MTEQQKVKKKRSFPTAYTVLFIILIFAALLTWVIPAGSFERLAYDAEAGHFIKTDAEGAETVVEATQQNLDKLGITVPLENFKNGKVYKPVAIPNSYKKIGRKPQGPVAVVMSMVTGLAESIDIISFILILGGLIGILNKTNTFAAGISALSRKTKGKEYLLIVIITLLITAGGTTFGMAEETIAFFPILMPIFLASGYDAMVCIATIYLASSVGTMFSTTNPFSVVLASNAAGISFTDGIAFRFISLVLATLISLFYLMRYANKVKNDPSQSLLADEMPAIKERFLHNYDADAVIPFDWRKSLMLTLFGLGFPVMIWGVSSQGWWFNELTTLFLCIGIICMIISGLSEKEAINTFIDGAAELISVALIVAVARAINIVMDAGMISDTILQSASGIISGVNGVLFSTVQMILFSFLGIFIPSSSGLATLSMPIVAPLADVVHVGRDVVVSAYNEGQGWMAFITPTGLILAVLELVDVSYDKWLKFVWPLMVVIGIFSVIMLALQTIM